jgi:exonuclease III
VQKYCSEQAAIQLKKQKGNIIIICIYRAPSGNFDIFLHNLETELHTYYTHTTDLIICGDMNVNYWEPDDKKDQLNNLLGTFNMTATVTFPTHM